MARRKKQTVDYFPHTCNHKKTMFIIKQKFGNDGYAFWYQMLEILGKTEGHSINCDDPATWQYLLAECDVSEEKAKEIMTLLVTLNAIDGDLWERDRVVWVQNFIDGLVDVYGKRVSETPQKPCFRAGNDHTGGVSGVGNTQSKVKESKVNNPVPDKPVQESTAVSNEMIKNIGYAILMIKDLQEHMNQKDGFCFKNFVKVSIKKQVPAEIIYYALQETIKRLVQEQEGKEPVKNIGAYTIAILKREKSTRQIADRLNKHYEFKNEEMESANGVLERVFNA